MTAGSVHTAFLRQIASGDLSVPRSDHQVSHIKLNCQRSTKRQQYVNIFDGIEMARQKRVKYVKIETCATFDFQVVCYKLL